MCLARIQCLYCAPLQMLSAQVAGLEKKSPGDKSGRTSGYGREEKNLVFFKFLVILI